MLEIQINKIEVQHEYDFSKKREKEYVIVNGIADIDSNYSGTGFRYARICNKEVNDILTSHSFRDVGNFFDYFFFNIKVDWCENELELDINCSRRYDKVPS